MIIQIIPCPIELHAKYKQDKGEFITRVICLALVEKGEGGDTYRAVEGMDLVDNEISLVENNTNFLGYVEVPLGYRMLPVFDIDKK